MKSTFVDTSGWFAALARRDRDHPVASEFIRSWKDQLVTTDYGLDETLTLIQRRIDHGTAVESFNKLERSTMLTYGYTSYRDKRAGCELTVTFDSKASRHQYLRRL